MKDFNKEELNYLLETVNYCIEEFAEQNPAYSVQCKLKSIIDNYCLTCEYMRKPQGYCETIGCTAK